MLLVGLLKSDFYWKIQSTREVFHLVCFSNLFTACIVFYCNVNMHTCTRMWSTSTKHDTHSLMKLGRRQLDTLPRWSQCSVTCGDGFQTAYISCTVRMRSYTCTRRRKCFTKTCSNGKYYNNLKFDILVVYMDDMWGSQLSPANVLTCHILTFN